MTRLASRSPLLVGLLAAVVAITVPAARPAAAATLHGYDISWPQCATATSGAVLPPASAQFVVIGLTRGLPFTENPCLRSQVEWAVQNGTPAQAYTIPAFPTAAQLTAYASAGPWSAGTRAGQLSNVGYAEATFALTSLRTASFRPGVVWIDVEPRSAQPWPAVPRENRYVVEGLMRAFRDAGQPYGVYSNQSGWQTITGNWWLPGVPVWATAGRLDYPNEALDRCVQPSFSGGPVFLSQWFDTLDNDLTCGSYQVTPLPMPPSTLSNSTGDWNGDWTNDVFARYTTSGDLWFFPGNGASGWLPYGPIGWGWQIMNALVTPGDWNGDGAQDVMAREAATGALWLYPGDGHGGWLPRTQVGWGWNAVNAIIGVGDWNGDQRADILARDGAGVLWLYPGNGTGGWLPRTQVGWGWQIMTAIVGVGDFSGDRSADVLARDGAGALWLYPGNGAGGWLPRTQVGQGWNPVDLIF